MVKKRLDVDQMGSGYDIEQKVDATMYSNIPYNLIQEELEGLYGNKVLAEMQQIIKYYDIYEHGAEFKVDTGLDYIPADYRSKQAKRLVDKQARFMFAATPDMLVDIPTKDNKDTGKEQSILQGLIDKVLSENNIARKLIAAAKDCFIGKRVAWVVNFNEATNKISISFIPSLGFVYEIDDDEELSKLVIFYALNSEDAKSDQRIYKKKYWLENGKCNIEEAIYDGMGNAIDEPIYHKTEFPYIPGGIILNDALTGDLDGTSDIEQLASLESWLNKISSSDLDSERGGMNPILYTIDCNPNSTKDLSRAPGAYWDLSTDDNIDGGKASVGVLESNMAYSEPLNSTIERIKTDLYESVDIPDTSSQSLKGMITSGKTLKAIYWSLMVRCDEKFLVWKPQLKHLLESIIDGAIMFPQIAKTYIEDKIPQAKYVIEIQNNYPIQDDQTEEKEMDLQEVARNTMSKKAYMQKWRGLSDAEVEAELEQIALERQYEDTAYFPNSTVNQNKTINEGNKNVEGLEE